MSVYNAIIHAHVVFSASMSMVEGGWWRHREGGVDGMAAHVPSVTHEVESRLLQGQNVVQGAMRNQRSTSILTIGGMDEVRMRSRCWSLLVVLETSVTQS